jgi:hypothetical protein
MGHTFDNGKTDWHNWMRDTMGILPTDEKSIKLVWAVIAQCNRERATVKEYNRNKRKPRSNP